MTHISSLPAFDAAIFDLDGLLIDSEPLWRRAEREVFASIGVTLTDQECLQTTGLRTDQLVAYWLERRPWDSRRHPVEAIARRIDGLVIEMIGRQGVAQPGVGHALDFMAARGLRLAIASSSTMAVIEAALARLGIAERFAVVHSADAEARSKPAPDVYLGAARRLGVDALRCVALEDSVAGLQAARAAGMRCVWVPEQDWPEDGADLVLGSLLELNEDVWDRLAAVGESRSGSEIGAGAAEEAGDRTDSAPGAEGREG